MGRTVSRALIALLPLLVCSTAPSQDESAAAKFPPRGWREVKPDKKERRRLDHTKVTQLTAKQVFKLRFTRPAGWPETVVTTADGDVLGRTGDERFEFPDRKVGDRYTIYLSDPKKRRYLEFSRDFVEYPNKTFPGKGWRPKKDARLQLQGARQFTPKTMIQAFDEPHRLLFRPGKEPKPVVYLLAKLDAGGKDEVASQSLTGELPLWLHAKRGESFRVYALSPHDGTYRVTEAMRVEKDYPLGK